SPSVVKKVGNNRNIVYKIAKSAPKYNILVVRVKPSGQLENSQPCSMCVYLMQLYGIYRVYYSNDQGQICYQKVSDYTESSDYWASRGASRMLEIWGRNLKQAKLPLSRHQKNRLLNQSPRRFV